MSSVRKGTSLDSLLEAVVGTHLELESRLRACLAWRKAEGTGMFALASGGRPVGGGSPRSSSA